MSSTKDALTVTRRALLGGMAASLAAPAIVRAQGNAPIRIGEINSYTAYPAFTVPYRNGWQLAVDEINAHGGVLGRKIQVVSQDDGGKPQDAIRIAGQLVNDEKVDLMSGTYLSDIGLAVSSFCQHSQKLFVAGEPLTDTLVWQKGNRYCFRLRPSTYMEAAMLVPEAAKLPAKRWATLAPNYELGQAAVKWFTDLLRKQRPDVQFVAQQWPALGHMDAAATIEALQAAKPEAIFNVTFGSDLINFVRQGNTRGLFNTCQVVAMLAGEPEYLEPMGNETPKGWIVTGYPWWQLQTPANKAFVAAYQQRFKADPRTGSLCGYALFKSIAAGIARSGSLDTERLIAGFSGAHFDTPTGPAMYRALDHQSTMGDFVGRTEVKDGKGTLVDWHYVDGSAVQPSDAEVRKLRPGG